MAKTPGDDRLKTFAMRIASMLQELAETREDLKEVKAEAKASGFDPGVLVKAVKYRMKNADEREKLDSTFDLFAYYVKQLTGEDPGGRPIEAAPVGTDQATTH